MKWKNKRNCALDCYQHRQLYQIQELDNKSKSMSDEKTQINDIHLIRSLYDNYIHVICITSEDKSGRTVGMEHMKKVKKENNCHTGNLRRDNQKTPSVSCKPKNGLRNKTRDSDISVKIDTTEKEVTDKEHTQRDDSKNNNITVSNVTTEIAIDEQKAPILSMDHIKKIQIKEKRSPVTDCCRHRNQQRGRVVSMKHLKDIRAVVKISTKNKELVEEIARSFFEHNKLAPLERNAKSIDISHTKDGYLIELIGQTFTGDNVDLSNYCNRLITFSDWPLDAPVSGLRLAAAGFYSCKKGTQVECFSCGLSLSDWSPPDNNPQIRHEELSPLCLFINSNKEESATGGSEYMLEFPTLNRELNDVTKSNPDENVHESSAKFNEAVDIENLNTKTISSSSSSSSPSSPSSSLEEDNADARQNIAIDRTDTPIGENASQRGLPIDQPVDNISTQEIENVPVSLPTDTASNRNVSDNSIPRQEPGRSDHLHEVDYSQLDYQNFAMAKHPQYESPKRRLETFRSWSYHNVQHPQRLVEAGFYYTDSTDVVRCYHCDIGLAEWAVEDDPWVEHARHSPQCYFLREKQGMDFVDNVQRSWREIYTPKCPQFEDFHVRHSTFQGWPSDRDQSPRELAAAGFYYTGEDDTVRCHYCDGGLRQWEPGDNPWVEHARWFPFCKYVVKMKGLPFIEEVARTYNELYVDNIENQLSSAETYGAYGMDGLDNGNTSNDANRNALSKAASVSVLEMGYSKNTLMMAINEYLKRTGNRDFTTEDLLLVITETNEDELPKDDDETEKSSSEIALQDIPRINAEELNNEELRQVNKQIKNKVFLCKTCKVKDRNMIFIPCGHRETCEQCAEKTMICFTCGDFINKRVKTFLS